MADYVAIMLNGLFTGVGVIVAHEMWDVIKEYRKKAKELIKNNIYIE
jgi:hypothetical protein